MCKILSLTNMANVKVTPKFIKALRDQVCATSDKHGFGYSVLTEQGDIWGEKTIEPMTFEPLSGIGSNKLDSLPFVSRSVQSFGRLLQGKAKALTAHGRFSTNSVSIENTHPFVSKGISMIHNGVVHDAAVNKLTGLKTDNDTEIVFEYWKRNGIDAVSENVSGYYALAILESSGNMTIVRDDRASLYISYSPTIDSFIIATTIDIIDGLCKTMKWRKESPRKIFDNQVITFDRNKVMSCDEFLPLETYTPMTATEKTALGYSGTSEVSEVSIYDRYLNNDDAPLYSEKMSDEIDEYCKDYGLTKEEFYNSSEFDQAIKANKTILRSVRY